MKEVNYNPVDPEKMSLPTGKTCGNCACWRDRNAIGVRGLQ